MLQDIICNHIMSPLVERYPSNVQRCMLDFQQMINMRRVNKFQMITSFAHELNVHNNVDFFGEGRVQHMRNSGLFGLDPSICTTRETASSRCTSVDTMFLSLSDQGRVTTLPKIWGEVLGGLRGLAPEPPLGVELGVARRFAICFLTINHHYTMQVLSKRPVTWSRT